MIRRRSLRALCRDRAGVAAVEFALSLPLLLLLMTLGIEYTNYVLTRKKISEIAALLADNASRMGDQSVLSNKPITEAEIQDLFEGAVLQAGNQIDLPQSSRIILSSLERKSDGHQWIHWQRCFGTKVHDPVFGREGDGNNGTSITGMGPPSWRVTADAGSAVMFVEISYRYRPIIGLLPLSLQDVTEFAAFRVRDERDLSGIHSANGVTPATCA